LEFGKCPGKHRDMSDLHADRFDPELVNQTLKRQTPPGRSDHAKPRFLGQIPPSPPAGSAQHHQILTNMSRI
jgi:hypothetical protein